MSRKKKSPELSPGIDDGTSACCASEENEEKQAGSFSAQEEKTADKRDAALRKMWDLYVRCEEPDDNAYGLLRAIRERIGFAQNVETAGRAAGAADRRNKPKGRRTAAEEILKH